MARPRVVTDAQIEQAARAVFLKHGAAAPVSLIADALSVSQAALFHRARSKNAILQRALTPGVPEAAALLRAGPTPGPVRAQLAGILGNLLRYLSDIIPSLIVLRSAGVPIEQKNPGAEPPTVLLRRLLTRWLLRARAQKRLECLHPSVTAEALLGALEARAFNGYLGGLSFTPASDAKFVARLIAGLVQKGRS